jgi:hypothetical protein
MEWMDGWIGGWMDGMDRWIDGWVGGRKKSRQSFPCFHSWFLF